ncbi:hypothetical protein KW542_07750 [Vibrio fluvialis]|nr:hypothetical protein [Vibrio fluvialis]
MTAEVAVHNRSAIALAADSASTISNGQREKTYNNAEKLFALTKHHPVGIMVYGAGELNQIPWELIIKSYRKELGTRSYDHLDDYISSFLEYLPKFFTRLPPNEFKEYLLHVVVDYFNHVQNECEPLPDDGSVTFEYEFEAYIRAVNTIYTELIDDNVPFLEGFSEDHLDEIRNMMSSAIDTFKAEFFSGAIDGEELPEHVESEFVQAFTDLCCIAYIKVNYMESRRTGLVFAGYGDKEYLPQIKTYEVTGLYKDCVRYQYIKSKTVVQGEIGIIPFAQQAEVQIFMQGISNPIKNMYDSLILSLAQKATSEYLATLEAIDVFDDETKVKMVKGFLEKLREHNEKESASISEYVTLEHIDKVIDMVEHLPKNELAYMAESLVNLTAFKRKVSNDNETVGGPIDVAVISKGDGFVWVKRKHYFPNELNKNYSN